MSWWRRKKNIEVLSPLEGYNKWAASYAFESNPIKKLSDEFIIRHLPDLAGKSLLDCGCGTGKFCLLASKKNASRIHGIDLSPMMIEAARQSCPTATFQCADISGTPIPIQEYDVVLSALVMGHLPDLNPGLTHQLKALKVGGVIIMTDFHPFLTLLNSKRSFKDPRSGKSYEIKHYLHLFESYFRILHDNGMRVEVLEEPLHNDTPVIFGLKARKT
jgi:malonyl-CoA O-methyltransferase